MENKPDIQSAQELAKGGKVGGAYACAFVERIVDGDTFTIDSGIVPKIRLAGVNTPEMSTAEGPSAKAGLEELLGPGDNILLLNVETQPGSGPYSERLAALVYKGGTLINEEIVRQGWAVPTEHLYKVPTPEAKRIRDALADAKRFKRGLWKKFPNSDFLKPYNLITDITEFPEIDDLEQFSKIPGATRLGTIWFYVPPTQINVTEHNANREIPLVRAPGSARVKTNQMEQRVELYAIFPNRWSVNYQFRPLLAQFIRSPFLPLKNEHVEELLLPSYAVPDDFVAQDPPGAEAAARKAIKENFKDHAPDGANVTDIPGRMMNAPGGKTKSTSIKIRDRNLFVALRNMVVSTVPGKPQGLQVTFILSAYNYLQHTDKVEYLKTMDDVVKQLQYFEELAKLKYPDGDPKELDTLRAGISTTTDISKSEPFKQYYRTLLAEGNFPELNSHLVWGKKLTPRLLQFHQERLDDISFKVETNLLGNRKIRENQVDIEVLSEEVEVLIQAEVKKLKTPLQALFGSAISVANLFKDFMFHAVQDSLVRADTVLNNRDILVVAFNDYLDANSVNLASAKSNLITRDATAEDVLRAAMGTVLRNPRILQLTDKVLRLEEENRKGTDETITAKLETNNRTIIASVSASYSPLVVPVGTLDHRLPSMQFFGKSDWVISVNIHTCDRNKVNEIMDLFQRSRMNRMVQNDVEGWYLSRLNAVDVGLHDFNANGFFNALGINKVLLDDFTNETVQGKPGWWNLTLRLVQADLNISEWEKLIRTNYASNDVQKQILRNLKDNGVPAGSTTGAQLKKALDNATRQVLIGLFQGVISNPLTDERLNAVIADGSLQDVLITNMDNPEKWEEAIWKIFSDMAPKIRAVTFSSASPAGLMDPRAYKIEDPKNDVGTAPLFFQTRIKFSRTAFTLAMNAEINQRIAGIRSGTEDQKREIANLYDPHSTGSVEDTLLRIAYEGEVAQGSFLHSCYPDLELPIYTRNPYMVSPDFFYRRNERVPTDGVASVQAILDKYFQSALLRARRADTAIETPEEVITGAREYIIWKKTKNVMPELAKLIAPLPGEEKSNLTAEQALEIFEKLKEEPTPQEMREELEDLELKEYSNVPVNEMIAAKRLALLYKIGGIQKQVSTANEYRGETAPIEDQDRMRKKQADLLAEFNSMGQMISAGAIDGLWGTVTPSTILRNQLYLKEAAKFRVNRARSEEIAGSMARSYPTVKVYFVEEDAQDWGLLDDYYSYQSINSVQVVASRDSASKVATIQLTNMTRKLSDQRATLGENLTADQTENEQDLRSFVLREGTTILIKGGYSNEVSLLETMFYGKVVSVSAGEVIQVVAQSFGAELTNPIFKGEEKKLGYLFSSARSIGDVAVLGMSSVDGLDHFGTRSWLDILKLRDPSEDRRGLARSNPKYRAWETYTGFLLNPVKRIVDLDVQDPRLENAYLQYTGNIFSAAKQIRVGATSFLTSLFRSGNATGATFEGLSAFSTKRAGFDWYTPGNQSLWQMLQEMVLYHNDYICTVLPYNENKPGAQRETIYIGPRDGLYKYTDQFETPELTKSIYDKNTGDMELDIVNPDHLVDENGKPLQGYTPVVNHHWIDSGHDIIDNSITATAERLHNKVTIRYGGEPGRGTGEEFTVVADDNIKDGNIRHLVVQQPNIDPAAWEDVKNTVITPWLKKLAARDKSRVVVSPGALGSAPVVAQTTGKGEPVRLDDVPIPTKYTVASNILAREMSKMYGGTLRIWARPSLKPYDQIYLNDGTNMMFGPIEADTVVHDFNSETGFTTTITPAAVVTPRNQTKVYHDIAMNGLFQHIPWAAIREGRISGAILSVAPWAGYGLTGVVATSVVSSGVRSLIGAALRGVTGGVIKVASKVPTVLSAAGAVVTEVGLGTTLSVVGGVTAITALIAAYWAGGLWTKGVCKVMGRDIINVTGLFYNGVPFVAGMEGAYKDSFRCHLGTEITNAQTLGIVQETFGTPLTLR